RQTHSSCLIKELSRRSNKVEKRQEQATCISTGIVTGGADRPPLSAPILLLWDMASGQTIRYGPAAIGSWRSWTMTSARTNAEGGMETSYGFQKVGEGEKQGKVNDVFHK